MRCRSIGVRRLFVGGRFRLPLVRSGDSDSRGFPHLYTDDHLVPAELVLLLCITTILAGKASRADIHGDRCGRQRAKSGSLLGARTWALGVSTI